MATEMAEVGTDDDGASVATQPGAVLPDSDQFGLQWFGSCHSDDSPMGWIRELRPGEDKVVVYAAEGLAVGFIRSVKPRTPTGVAFTIYEASSLPAGVGQIIDTVAGHVHACKRRPCDRELRGEGVDGHSSRVRSWHVHGIAMVPAD